MLLLKSVFPLVATRVMMSIKFITFTLYVTIKKRNFWVQDRPQNLAEGFGETLMIGFWASEIVLILKTN